MSSLDRKDATPGACDQIEIAGPERSFTMREERRYVRKLDMVIMPPIMVMYLLSYMDR